MLIIGPAGERQSLAAGVQNLDKEGSPSRICARGGLGALMGSKQVKAIVFDPGERPRMAFADSERVAALQKIYNQTLLQDAFVKTLTTLGTAGNTLVDDMVGALPTRNFSSGSFEGAEAISGEELLGRIRRRKGNPSHACMAGCIIRCSNSLPDEDGSLLVSPLDFETIAMLGSNLGIDDLDLIAQINYELNDLGLDTIEMGAALGVAADGGVWKFGDQQRLKEIVAEIRAGTPLGRLLANGAYQTGIALGVERIPVVKRQAMAAYDPRVLQVTGITYATSAQGADHTAGMTLRAASKNQTPEDLARISRRLQVENAALDAIGACLFAGSGFKADPQFLPALVEAVFGEAVESDFFHDLGEKTLSWEWEYNQKVGFSRADDRIPGWMQTEPLPPTGRVFDLPGAVLDSLNG
jgi:aldehyde:ferredoxin oxidoreductase